jgi:hypothetical protein
MANNGLAAAALEAAQERQRRQRSGCFDVRRNGADVGMVYKLRGSRRSKPGGPRVE